MGMVYFKSDDGTIVTMDSETSIDVSKSNTVASSSVVSTRTVADELIQGNLTIGVTGLVTYTKSSNQNGNPTPSEWIDLIEAAISNSSRFTLYSVKYSGGNPLLKDYPNLVIQDYGYVVDRYESTITARITFKEIFVSGAATTTFLAPAQSSSTTSSYQEPTTGGKGTSTSLSNEEVESTGAYIVSETGSNVFSSFLTE